MEHPTHEELFAHLEGAATPESAARVEKHLTHCPVCAAELAGWRRSIEKLRDCEWPNQREAIRSWWRPAAIKWVVAAVLVLGFGFALGRVSVLGTARFKDAVAAEVGQQLRQELRADLLAAVAAHRLGAGDAFQQRLRREFETSLAATAKNSNPDRQRLVWEVLDAVRENQAENQLALVARLNRIEQQQASDYLTLRHDLETAVSVADDDLKLNHRRLTELAATVLAKTVQP